MSLLDRLREGERDGWPRGAEQFGEHGDGVCMSEMERLQHAGEHGLGFGAVPRPIAAADLAYDDRRAERLFCPPVGGVNGRRQQEGEGPRKLDGQMRRKDLRPAGGAHVVDQFLDAIDQMPAARGDALRRHRVGGMAVPERQCLLQAGANARRPAGPVLLLLGPLAFELRALLFKAPNLATLPFDLGVLSFALVDQLRSRSGLPRCVHAMVMTDSRSLYRGKMKIAPGSLAGLVML